MFSGLWFDPFEVAADGLEYRTMAENMLAGRGFTYDGENSIIGKTPGMPALIAMFVLVAGSTTGFHTLQLLLLFLGYLGVTTVAKRTMGAGIAATVLCALVLLYPIRSLASNLLSEPLFIALFAWGLALTHQAWTSQSRFVAVLAGILFGLSSYVRPVSLFWPLLLLMVWLAVRRRQPQIGFIVLMAHLAVVTPWIIRGYVKFGEFVAMASNWGPMLMMADDDLWQKFSRTGTNEVYQSPYFLKAAEKGFLFNHEPQAVLRAATLQAWKSDPSGCLWRCLKQTLFAWTYCPGTKEWKWRYPIVFSIGRFATVMFLIVSVLGLTELWRAHEAAAILIGGQLLYTAGVMFPVASESRYLVPAYICLLPATACGVSNMMRWLRRFPRDN